MSQHNGLWLRAALIQALRRFFINGGYLEVDTPVRIPAPAPEAYIEPEPAGGWFLQTSPELCMKRLLASGIPKLFQICKCFRRNERGRRHLPEFAMLEWYRSGIDYHSLMTECEELFGYLVKQLDRGCCVRIGGQEVPLDRPWERLRVEDAFQRHAPVSVAEALRTDCFDEMLVRYIEPHLGMERPAFLYDYPAALGALARVRGDAPDTAERFELYIGGIELANGFSELTDANEQRARFEKEMAVIQALGREHGPMPQKFLDDLEQMPEAAGIALGVDRLVMLFLGAESIDEAVPFTPEDL